MLEKAAPTWKTLKRHFLTLSVASCLFVAGYAAPCSASGKIPVFVTSQVEDIGDRIVYFLKDSIRESSQFYLSDVDFNTLDIAILSIDPDRNVPRSGRFIAYSTVWTINGEFLTSTVGTCGRDVAKSCAESLLVHTDKVSDNFHVRNKMLEFSVTTMLDAAKKRSALQAEFRKKHACPSTKKMTGDCPGYVVGRIISACKGGTDDISNLEWQTNAIAEEKAREEVAACSKH